LQDLLKSRRDVLLSCWTRKTEASSLSTGPLPPAELVDRMPAFVDQVIAALDGDLADPAQIKDEAAEHGAQRLRLGFDVSEVIREYWILHDCVLDLAGDARLTIDLREQAALAKWLNSGIAGAVSQYVRERDREQQRQASEHLGFIAHELRGPLSATMMALPRLRLTQQAAGGKVLDLLERNLRRTSEMIENVLVDSSLKLGVEARPERIELPAFLQEIEREVALEAQAKKIAIVISTPPELTIEADSKLLRSATLNLVVNALKFSRSESTIELQASRSQGQVVIAVADGCGGLPLGKADELFRPLVQRDKNRTGYGLGLAIAQQAAVAHAGTITLRDIPGQGCVFSIVLPSAGS
jgi:signal transduction histidine kinase